MDDWMDGCLLLNHTRTSERVWMREIDYSISFYALRFIYYPLRFQLMYYVPIGYFYYHADSRRWSHCKKLPKRKCCQRKGKKTINCHNLTPPIKMQIRAVTAKALARSIANLMVKSLISRDIWRWRNKTVMFHEHNGPNPRWATAGAKEWSISVLIGVERFAPFKLKVLCDVS